MNKKKIIALVISSLSFIGMTILLLFVINTKGYIGWMTWEVTGLIFTIFLGLLGLTSLALAIVCLFKEKTIKGITIYSSIVLGLVISLSLHLVVSGNLPDLKPNLNFYYSSDSYIADLASDHSVDVAVFSDTHYGASSANKEARTNIINDIKKNNYDLVVHGGDLVDLGFKSSYYKQAINELEDNLKDQKMSFVMGNHDALINGEHNFRKMFQKGEDSLNHVLNIAPTVHWVIFNNIWDYNEVKTSDIDWLKETLASFPKEDCVIVQSHAYYYGSGYDYMMGTWRDIDNSIEHIVPIFEEYNVDLVISGHIHSMEMMEQNGVHYSLVGSAGGSLVDEFKIDTKAHSTFKANQVYGYTNYIIKDSKEIEINYINQDGSTLYSETITY